MLSYLNIKSEKMQYFLTHQKSCICGEYFYSEEVFSSKGELSGSQVFFSTPQLVQF